jgi:hypothetical protein
MTFIIKQHVKINTIEANIIRLTHILYIMRYVLHTDYKHFLIVTVVFMGDLK